MIREFISDVKFDAAYMIEKVHQGFPSVVAKFNTAHAQRGLNIPPDKVETYWGYVLPFLRILAILSASKYVLKLRLTGRRLQ